MNTKQNAFPSSASAESTNAEARLEASRSTLYRRLKQKHAGQPSDVSRGLGDMVKMASPLARMWIRQHPYASLSTAAFAGMMLVRLKPWRGLSGSLFAGLLARQVLTLLQPSGRRTFNWLLDSALNKSNIAPQPATIAFGSQAADDSHRNQKKKV